MENQNYDLTGAIDSKVDSGVECGRELVTFAAAIVGNDASALDVAREVLMVAMGSPAVVTASLIAANFSMLDRIANAVGISLDEMVVKPSADIRELLGINDYPSAVNTPSR